MTQEDKELLLKDLAARLPYEVKGIVYAETTNGKHYMDGEMIYFDTPFDTILDTINTTTEEIHVVAIGNEDTVDFIEDQQNYGEPYSVCEFKPYLRPISSMTKEERMVLLKYGSVGMDENDKVFDVYPYGIERNMAVVDFLNEHHFDYRGLIEKGLALEAPEGMYKFE